MLATDLQVNRPKPINTGIDLRSFTQDSDIEETINELHAGEFILIKDFYSSGLILLKALKVHLSKKHLNESFHEQRTLRAEYRKLSHLILIEVKAHKLNVKKAPSIGWFEKLYPEINDFILPFPEIQGLNSAWQWYSNGVKIPCLRNKIHPYFGVYFPTRFEHLYLFDNWLSHYNGLKKTAIDVGIGNGVLSFLLIKHGFQKSFGTDINPNAIIGLNEAMEGTKLSRKIEIMYGHLFASWDKLTELIVFNPPWLPAIEVSDGLDEAMYYNDKLFADFFEEAKKRLHPEGRIVLLFSNLGQITHMSKDHPIEKELLSGGRYVLDKCFKKTVKLASDKTKRNQYWRSTEEVELWVLKHL
jgi:hypothetical protein